MATVAIKRDLKALANMKIKIDLLTTQYKEQMDALRKDFEDKVLPEKRADAAIVDPDGILSLGWVETSRRTFSVEGVRKTLGEVASQCISESVDAKAFDALTKKKNKSTLTEEQQKACFSVVKVPSISWEGMEQYKGGLMERSM